MPIQTLSVDVELNAASAIAGFETVAAASNEAKDKLLAVFNAIKNGSVEAARLIGGIGDAATRVAAKQALMAQQIKLATDAFAQQVGQAQAARNAIQAISIALDNFGSKNKDVLNTVLNVRGTDVIQGQLNNVTKAFAEVENSGRFSAQEISRAYESFRGTVVKLKAELDGLPASVNKLAAARSDIEALSRALKTFGGATPTGNLDIARSILGTRSTQDILRELALVKAAFEDIKNSGTDTLEVQRTLAALEARAKALNTELGITPTLMEVFAARTNIANAAIANQAEQFAQARTQAQQYLATLRQGSSPIAGGIFKSPLPPGVSYSDVALQGLGGRTQGAVSTDIQTITEALTVLRVEGTATGVEMSKAFDKARVSLAVLSSEASNLPASAVALRVARAEAENLASALTRLGSTAAGIDLSFATVGIRPIADIQRQIDSLNASLVNLRQSGKVSPEDILRLDDATALKIAALRQEMGQLLTAEERLAAQTANANNTIRQQVEQMQQARVTAQQYAQAIKAPGAQGVAVAQTTLGVRPSADIQRDIDNINASLAKIRATAGKDFDLITRGAAAAEVKIAALNAEMVGLNLTSAAGGVHLGALLRTLRQFTGITSLLGIAYALERMVTATITTADSATLLINRLTVLYGTAEQAREVFKQLADDADRLRVPVEDNVKSFARLALVVKDLDGTTVEARKLNDVLQLTGKISGATADEIAQATRQFLQAMAIGRLQGQDLKALTQQNYGLAVAIAEAVTASGKFGKVTVGELHKLGSEGKLTFDIILPGLLALRDRLADVYTGLPKTATESWTVLTNQFYQLTDQVNRSLGVTEKLGAIFVTLAADIKSGLADGSIIEWAQNAAIAVTVTAESFIFLGKNVGILVNDLELLITDIQIVIAALRALGKVATDIRLKSPETNQAIDDLRDYVDRRSKIIKEGDEKLLALAENDSAKYSKALRKQFAEQAAIRKSFTGGAGDSEQELASAQVANKVPSTLILSTTTRNAIDEFDKEYKKVESTLEKAIDEYLKFSKTYNDAFEKLTSEKAVLLEIKVGDQGANVARIVEIDEELEALRKKYASGVLDQGNKVIDAQNQQDKKDLERAKLLQGDKLSNVLAGFTKEEAFTTSHYNDLEKLAKDASQRQLAVIEHYTQLGLISELDAIRERGVIELSEAQSHLSKLEAAYAASQKHIQQLQNTPTTYTTPEGRVLVDQDARATIQLKINDELKQSAALVTDITIARNQETDALTKTAYAQDNYLAKLRDTLITIQQQSQDYAISVDRQVAAAKLQVDLLGQTELAIRNANIERDAALKIQDQQLSTERQLQALALQPGGARPEEVQARVAAMEEFRQKTLSTVEAMKQLAAAEIATKNYVQGISDAWHIVSDLTNTFFDNLSGGWKSAVNAMATSFRSTVLKAVSELVNKNIVLPIFAKITGESEEAIAPSGSFSLLNALNSLIGGRPATPGSSPATQPLAILGTTATATRSAMEGLTTSIDRLVAAIEGEIAQRIQNRQIVGPPTPEELLPNFVGPPSSLSLSNFAGPFQDVFTPVVASLSATTKQFSGDVSDVFGDTGRILKEVATKYDVPVNALIALAQQETGLRPGGAYSHRTNPESGAAGLFQITPENAAAAGIDPENVRAAAEWTAKELIANFKRFGGDMQKALTAHFGGPNTNIWKDKTAKYSEEINAKYIALNKSTEQLNKSIDLTTAKLEPLQKNADELAISLGTVPPLATLDITPLQDSTVKLAGDLSNIDASRLTAQFSAVADGADGVVSSFTVVASATDRAAVAAEEFSSSLDGASTAGLEKSLESAGANISDFASGLGGVSRIVPTLGGNLSAAGADLSDFSSGLGGAAQAAPTLADNLTSAGANLDDFSSGLGGVDRASDGVSSSFKTTSNSSTRLAGGFGSVLSSLGGFAGGLISILRLIGGIGSLFGGAGGAAAGGLGGISNLFSLGSSANTLAGNPLGLPTGGIQSSITTGLQNFFGVPTTAGFSSAGLSAAASGGVLPGSLSLGVEAGSTAAELAAGGAAMEAGSLALSGTIAAAVPVVGWIAAAATVGYSLLQASKKPTPTEGQFQITPSSTPASNFEDNFFTPSRFGNIGFADQGTKQFSGEAAQAFNKLVATALDTFQTRYSPEQSARLAGILQSTAFPHFEGTFNTEDFIKQYGGQIFQQVVQSAFDVLDPALGSVVANFKGTTDELTKFSGSLLAIYDATKVFGDSFSTTLGTAFVESFNAKQGVLTSVASSAIETSFSAVKPDHKPLVQAVDQAFASVKPDPKILARSIGDSVNDAVSGVAIKPIKPGAVGAVSGSTYKPTKPGGVDTTTAPVLFDTDAAAEIAARNFAQHFIDSINAALADATQETADKVLAFVTVVNSLAAPLPALALQLAALDPASMLAFVDAMGGASKVAETFAYISTNFTTAAQKLQGAQTTLTSGFAQLHLAVPKTHADFLALLASFDLTTEAGRTLYASVSALAPAFVAVSGTADEAAGSTQEFAQALQTAQQQIDEARKALQPTSASFGTFVTHLQDAFNTAAGVKPIGGKGQFGSNSGDALNAALRQAGLTTIPTTTAQFFQMLDSIDQTTDAGKQLHAALSLLFPDFQNFVNSANSAREFFNTNFFTADEQATRAHAAALQTVADANKQFNIQIPTTVLGFRAYIDGLLHGDAASQAFAVTLINQVGPAILTLDTGFSHLADTMHTAADYINEQGDIWSTTLSNLQNLASTATTFKEQLTLAVDLTGSQVAKLQAKIDAIKAKPFPTALDSSNLVYIYGPALLAAKQANTAAANELAEFTILAAQYDDAKAEQLLKLEEDYAAQKKLFAGNAAALTAAKTIFDEKWQAIITGTTDAVDAMDDLLKKVNDLIGNFGGTAGDTLRLRIALLNSELTKALASVGGSAMADKIREQIALSSSQLTFYLTQLTATGSDEIASQLLDLQTWYDGLKTALAGNSEGLATLQAIFDRRWQEIITGTTDGANKFLDAIQKIKDYLQSLIIGDISPLSPRDRFAAAGAKYNTDLALAQAGNLDALGRITEDADAYLKLFRDVFASAGYGPFFNAIVAQLTALEIPPGAAPAPTVGTTVASALDTTSPTPVSPVGATTTFDAALVAALPISGQLLSSADASANNQLLLDKIDDLMDENTALTASLAGVIEKVGDAQLKATVSAGNVQTAIATMANK